MNPPPETATLDPKQAEREAIKDINQDYKTKFGFNDPETGYVYKAPKGLSRQLVEDISEYKDEPQWMREFRLKALEHFLARPVPQWGANLNQIDFDDIHYFVRASERAERSWDDVPEDVKRRRNNELLAIQNEISHEDNQPLIGRQVEVLVEGPSKAALRDGSRAEALQLVGRTHCDRIVVFEGNRRQVGELLLVDVLDANAFTLFGAVVTRHVGPEVYSLG